MSIVRSTSYDQLEILDSIKKLHCGEFEADISYGKGGFYKGGNSPKLKFDIDPQNSEVIKASSTDLPLEDNSLNSLVFDPPFLTYIKKGRAGNGSMIMANQFSGYWHYSELEQHYKETLIESARVLKKGGVMVFKCQDIIHNHKMHATHINTVNWAVESGFRLLDLFILTAKNRIPVKPHKTTPSKQRHARVHHCYFLVLKRV